MDGEQLAVVELYMYIGSLKSANGIVIMTSDPGLEWQVKNTRSSTDL